MSEFAPNPIETTDPPPSCSATVLVDSMPFGKLVVHQHQAAKGSTGAAEAPASVQVDGESISFALRVSGPGTAPDPSAVSSSRSVVVAWQAGPAFTRDLVAVVDVRVKSTIAVSAVQSGSSSPEAAASVDLACDLLGAQVALHEALSTEPQAGQMAPSGAANVNRSVTRNRTLTGADRDQLSLDRTTSKAFQTTAKCSATISGATGMTTEIKAALVPEWSFAVAIRGAVSQDLPSG